MLFSNNGTSQSLVACIMSLESLGGYFFFPVTILPLVTFCPLACDLDCRRACFYLTLCVSVCVWLVPFCQHDSQLVIPFLLKSNISHEPSFSLNRKFTLKFF